MDLKNETVLLYDGHCLMCSSLVKWVMKRDQKEKIRFGALQDDAIEPLMKSAPAKIRDADSVVLYTDQKFYMRSTAILKLYGILGFPWSMLTVFRIVPAVIRDAVYRFIARNRKRWFGKSDSCYLVPMEKRSLFITDPSKEYGE